MQDVSARQPSIAVPARRELNKFKLSGKLEFQALDISPDDHSHRKTCRHPDGALG
jgi:hypothetical protein